MTNIEDGLRYVARSIRNEINIEYTEEQRVLIGEMMKKIAKSDMLQSDFNGVEYCWYGVESNVKRMALEEIINEDYATITHCLNELYGYLDSYEESINEKHWLALESSEEVVDELELTSNMPYKMGINVYLSEAIQKYRCLVAMMLIHIYDGFRLDTEVEFYQFLTELLESRVN